MNRTVAFLAVGILLLPSSASSDEDLQPRNPGLGEPARIRACGHTTELDAAKRALTGGDREGAVRHLQRAQALLAACERNAVNPEPEWETTTSARAFATAPAAETTWPRAPRPGESSRSGV